MDEKKIVAMYTEGGYTLRHLADEFNTNHHRIKRILLKHNVEITRRNTLKKFSDEHKRKISESRKALFKNGELKSWQKGKKMIDHVTKNNVSGKYLLYRNMQAHMRHQIDLEWLMQFDDIEKLKFLNRSIVRKRDFGDYTEGFYKAFINKFYYDEKFNDIYSKWLDSNKDPLLKPSPDHITPRSKGGKEDSLDNIRFLTWFENRCKNNMSLEEWENVKKNIHKYFI